MNIDQQNEDEDVLGELYHLCSKTCDDAFLAGEAVLAWSNRRHSAALMNHYKAEVEQADQRHNIRPDRRARDHEINHTKTDGIDDINLLPELIVREKLDIDAVSETMCPEAFDEVIVVDAPIGELRIVRTKEFVEA